MAKNHVFVPLLHKYWMNLYWLYWTPHVILRPSPMSLCHLHVLHSSEFPTVSRLPTPSQHSDIPLPRILIKGLHIFDAFQVKFPRLHRSWLIVTTPPTKRFVESRLYKKKVLFASCVRLCCKISVPKKYSSKLNSTALLVMMWLQKQMMMGVNFSLKNYWCSSSGCSNGGTKFRY